MDLIITNPIVLSVISLIVGALISWWITRRGTAELKAHIDRQIPYTSHLREALKSLDGKIIEGEGKITLDQDADGNPIRMRILPTQEISGELIPSEEKVHEPTIELGSPPPPSPFLNTIPVVTKKADPDPAYVGSELTFHITLTNEGNSTAPDVTLSDVILPDMDLVSVTATAADGSDVTDRCSRDDPTPTTPSGAVGCRVGDIPGGESATMDVVVIPREPGVYTNHAGSGFPVPTGVTVDGSRNLTHVTVTVVPTETPIGVGEDAQAGSERPWWRKVFGG